MSKSNAAQRLPTYKEIDDAQGIELRALYKKVFGREDTAKGKAADTRRKIKDELGRLSAERGGKAQPQQKPVSAKLKASASSKPPGAAAAGRKASPVAVDSGVPDYDYVESSPGEFYAVERSSGNETGPYDSEDAALSAIRDAHRKKQRLDDIKQAASKAAPAKATAAKVHRDEVVKRQPAAAGTPVAKAQRETAGAYIREQIMAGGKRVEQIVEEVHAKFDGSGCTPKDVYWYRWKLGQDGKTPPPWPTRQPRGPRDPKASDDGRD